MINTIAITAIIAAMIILYFFFSVGESGFVGFIPTLPKFLRLNNMYQIKPNAIPIAAIKNPPWKFLTFMKCCKIIGETSAPKLTDI